MVALITWGKFGFLLYSVPYAFDDDKVMLSQPLGSYPLKLLGAHSFSYLKKQKKKKKRKAHTGFQE